MSDTPEPEELAAQAPPPLDAAARRHKKKRLYGFIAVVAFVGGGLLLFGPRMPREVHLRFALPPISRNNFAEIPRDRVAHVSATIAGSDGGRVATINLPSPDGLHGPRTAPAVLNLVAGKYVARVKVRSFESTEVMLEGLFEVDDTEVVVELKTAR